MHKEFYPAIFKSGRRSRRISESKDRLRLFLSDYQSHVYDDMRQTEDFMDELKQRIEDGIEVETSKKLLKFEDECLQMEINKIDDIESLIKQLSKERTYLP